MRTTKPKGPKKKRAESNCAEILGGAGGREKCSKNFGSLRELVFFDHSQVSSK